jgi:hypothetical protein
MRALALAALAAVASCDGVTADAGRDALLQVSGAQFFREAAPGAVDGPAVRTVAVSPRVTPGTADRRCAGELEPSATAVALSLSGDRGYWVLPSRVPDVSAPGFPTFSATLGFSTRLPPGPRDLVVRGVDASGRFGPPLARMLDVGSGAPSGRLVIALSWSDRADLDLHVVDPSGVEISKRNPSSDEPPPPGAAPEPPGTTRGGGVLDRDANAACVEDGARAEHVVWSVEPPRGRYVVRVGTASMCGAPVAYWRVEALRDGVRIGAAQGASTDADTRFADERGAGLLALELDLP